MKSIKKYFAQLFPKLSEKRKKNKFYTFYKKIIKNNHLCFDVGANIGKRTEVFLALGAEVVAIEPQSTCIKVLQEKFGKNQQVTIVPKGVAQQTGKAVLQICNMNEVSSLSNEFVDYYNTNYDYLNFEKVEEITITTLDHLITIFGLPHFCKIDVEGFEKQAIMGLSHAIPVLSFEFTAPFKKNTIECIKLLEQITAYQYNYSVYENMQFVLSKWVSAVEMIKILQKMPSTILVGDIYAKLNNSSTTP